MNDRLVFSCPHPTNAAGPSRPLTRIHEALGAWKMNQYRKLEPSDFPELTELSRLGDAIGAAFDDLALAALDAEDKPPWVFLGGCGASLHQMRWVHERRATSTAAILAFSSHWAHAERVLRPEYARFGIKPSPIHPYVAWRAAREQDEADLIIVPSDACAKTYPGDVQEKVRVAEFGVDTALFHPPEQPRPEGPLRVLMPATNPIRKGLWYVMEALKSLPAERFVFTITGASVQVSSKVVNTPGWVRDDDMRKAMQAHDVLLLPSVEEGQALASLEGAASGMALLLTPEVGLPITDYKEGRVVPARDAGAIADALRGMEADREETRGMGREARRFAEQRPWGRFEERIVGILKSEVGA